jgi:uncharacterized glyoxalase superfamily protein PhnB
MLTVRARVATLAACLAMATTIPVSAQEHATLRRLTPILSVESIEPVVPFWMALGWEPLNPMEVDGRIAFIAFRKDGQEIHYQTVAHIEEQIPGASDMLTGSTALLYLTVDDLDLVINALGSDVPVVIPRRSTPWGADEIYVREPGGHLIGFAKFGRD